MTLRLAAAVAVAVPGVALSAWIVVALRPDGAAALLPASIAVLSACGALRLLRGGSR